MQPHKKVRKKHIDMGGAFGPVSINVNGLEISVDAKGNATIITDGTVTAYGRNIIAHSDNVTIKPVTETGSKGALETSMDPQACNIGDKLPDGWIIMGVSPDTGEVFSAEPEANVLDGYQTWHKGEERAKDLRDAGHKNARQASKEELSVIYNDVVKAGCNDNAKFNTSGSFPYGIYWSSTQGRDGPDFAWVQYLDDGHRLWLHKDDACARVRCVRDEPGLKLA